MAIKVSNGGASVEIEGIDESVFLGYFGAALEAQAKAVDAEVEAVYAAAFEGWPKSGMRSYDSSRGSDTKRVRRAVARGYKVPTPRPRLSGDSRGTAYDLRRETTLDIELGVIEGRVYHVGAEYARFIKANNLAGKAVLNELLRKPIRKAGRRLAKTLAKITADGINDV